MGTLSFLGTFFYAFQLLNNWPRAIFLLWERSSPVPVPVLPLLLSRPPFDDRLFANSLDDIRNVYGKVLLSACSDSDNHTSGTIFVWKAALYSHVVRQWTTTSCRSHFFAPHQGDYSVFVTSRNRDNTTGAATARIVVRDIWMAAIGDSFASGEGNPDVRTSENSTAEWISSPCHRSRKSWPYRIFESVRRQNPDAVVHFSYLACTGATVERGVLGPPGFAQFATLTAIARERGLGPDLLMLSVGGNDVGYAEILEGLQARESQSMLSFLDWRFYYVTSQLTAVREAISQLAPLQVLLPLYFDFSRNERGEIDASCEDMNNIRTADVALAERMVLARLNSLLLQTGRDAGWTVEERIPALFRRGGICSKHRLIRSLSDSLSIQGDPLGAFHPNEEAHSRIAEMLVSRLRPL